MRKIIATLLIGVSSSAVMADDHYYAGFELGATKATDQRFSNSPNSGLRLGDEKKMGLMGGLYVGRAFDKWRLEAEYAIRTNSYESVDFANGSAAGLDNIYYNADGSQKSSALMVNAWYQFAEMGEWKALVGMGLGLADLEVNGLKAGGTTLVNDGTWSGAGQAMIQLVKPIKGGLEAAIGVRHFRTFSDELATIAGTSKYKSRHNEAFVRLSWRFGEADKPAPVAEPVRVAPAPVAEPTPARVETPQVVEEKPEPKPVALPGPFMVFFDFDKADITPAAAAIIRDAAKAFKEHGAVRIMTTGHTDRAGAESYNMKLAERRAAAVRAALMAEGVRANAIITRARGEGSPLVATGDGVREAQNRRAEIVLSR
ncbi:MAG: OmpA family protein [Alphaproteobacteria bacterium]|nr:OmpA family protein [Alphaproteobacteria bacterium]